MLGARPWIARILLVLVAVGAAGRHASADQAMAGRTYFMRYCASCHGIEADGHGFVARALAHPPSDLRHLGDRYGTPLPADRVARFIDGREAVTAHGEREMPVWGERFDDIKADGVAREKVVHERLAAIVAYLILIQAGSQQ
jgi:mono/diheme cytochrome c family protein